MTNKRANKKNLLKSKFSKKKLLDNLNKVGKCRLRHQDIIIYRYGLNYPETNIVRTNKETGKHFNLSRFNFYIFVFQLLPSPFLNTLKYYYHE